MPLYCFVCDQCESKFEDFLPVEHDMPNCPLCSLIDEGEVRRNYQAETKVMFDDIEPYFDFSIGQHISGRKDKATKYRSGGYTAMYNQHGGGVTSPSKRFYGDEEYAVNVQNINRAKPEWEKRYDDAIQEGLDSPGSEDEKDGTVIRQT